MFWGILSSLVKFTEYALIQTAKLNNCSFLLLNLPSSSFRPAEKEWKAKSFLVDGDEDNGEEDQQAETKKNKVKDTVKPRYSTLVLLLMLCC